MIIDCSSSNIVRLTTAYQLRAACRATITAAPALGLNEALQRRTTQQPRDSCIRLLGSCGQ